MNKLFYTHFWKMCLENAEKTSQHIYKTSFTALSIAMFLVFSASNVFADNHLSPKKPATSVSTKLNSSFTIRNSTNCSATASYALYGGGTTSVSIPANSSRTVTNSAFNITVTVTTFNGTRYSFFVGSSGYYNITGGCTSTNTGGGGTTTTTCSVSFSNTGCQTAELFWNNNGTLVSYGHIAANSTKNQSTSNGHNWVIKVGATTVGNYTANCSSPSYSFNSGGCTTTGGGGTCTYSITIRNTGCNSLSVAGGSNAGTIAGGSSRTFTGTGSASFIYTYSGGTGRATANCGTSTQSVNTGGCTPVCGSLGVVTEANINDTGWQTTSSISVCAGSKVTLSANPNSAASYRWTGPNGFSGVGNTMGDILLSNSITTAQSGTYYVEVTVNGCKETKQIQVNVTSLGAVTEANINDASWQTTSSISVCAGSKVTLSANPNSAASYRWTGPNGFSGAGNTMGDILLSNAITTAQSGTYSVEVTVNGCKETKQIQVTVSDLSATISGNTSVCNGGTTTLTASGGTSYQWSNGASGATVTVGAGTYTVTVTSGSCSATRSVTVTSGSVNATISGNTSVCNGGTTTLTASGGSSYQWSNGASGATVTVGAGTYTVTVTSGSCSATRSVTVTSGSVNATISGNTSVCSGGTTTLTASGGSSYQWSNGVNGQTVTVGAGTYTVTVTSGSCSATRSVTVTSGSVNATISGNTSVCNGGTTTLTASGGSSYQWSNGVNGQTVTVGAGTYTVTVTSGSCTATRSVTVTSGSVNATISGNTSVCNGGTTTLTANGGTSYQWSNGVNGQTVTVSAGTYVVTVTGNGCTATKTVTVKSVAPTLTLGSCPANITVTAAQGASCAKATWTAPTATATCGTPSVNSNYHPGYCFPIGTTTVTYTATLNGQTKTCSFTVTVIQNNPATGSIGDFVFCDNNNNSVYDNGDTPISGVTVTLCNADNVVITTAITNNSGNYSFGSLAAGAYIVKFPTVLADGKKITTYPDLAVPLKQGENITWADAGYYKPTVTTCTDGSPKKTPGTACDDHNPNTINDVIQADGCGCAGTPQSNTYCTRNLWNAKSANNPNGNRWVDTQNWDDIGVSLPNLYQAGQYTSFRFLQGAKFTENANGTARITGVIQDFNNPARSFVVDINFTGRTSTGTPYNLTQAPSTADWYYYTWSTATLTGQDALAGAVLNMTGRGGAFQVGSGANQVWNADDRVSLGGGGWFSWTVKNQPWQGITLLNYTSGDADVAILLPPCTPTSSGLASTKAILEMNARAELNRSRIDWVSNLSESTDFFTVQKLNEQSGDFEKLVIINSDNKSTSLEHFTSYDNSPSEGDNYYRIKATLYNGNEVFSTTQKVNFKNIGDVSVFPNPASDYIDIDLKLYEGKPVTIQMYNQLGKLILTKQMESASNTPFRISVDEKLSGQYLIRITSQGKRDVLKQITLLK